MSQIKKKFVGDNEISQTKIRLDNNTYLKARNAANSGDVNLIKINGSDEAEVALPLIVPTPTATNHAATKDYVDLAVGGAAVSGLKEACPYVTIENIDLVTGGLNINGQSYTAGARVLVWKQSLQEQNGIYIASAGAWTRANDADSAADFGAGFLVYGYYPYNGSCYVVSVSLSSFVLDTSPVNIKGINMYDGYEPKTLTSTDITNQYVDFTSYGLLWNIVSDVKLYISGLRMYEGIDYQKSIVTTTDPNDTLRITFQGDLATGGASELVAGDLLFLEFKY